MESVPGEEEKWGGGRGSRQLKGKGLQEGPGGSG